MEVLEVNRLKYSYDNRLSWYVDHSFQGGKVYQIIGENGTGKSTIARLLTGIEANFTGEICFNEINITHLNDKEKRDTFFYIPQEPYWSFIGDSFCSNMRYFNLADKNKLIEGLEDQQGLLEKLIHQSVFEMSSENVYLVSFYESLVWERPIIFIDECPDFDDTPSKNFLLQLLKIRNDKKLITFISRHMSIDLPGICSDMIKIDEFIKHD